MKFAGETAADNPTPQQQVTADVIEAVYPLSPMQEGLFFHSLLTPQLDVYFRQIIYRMEGSLDVALFKRAWQQVVNRHAVLRTAFAWKDLKISRLQLKL